MEEEEDTLGLLEAEDPTNIVSIHMPREDAEKLARALRMGSEAYDFLDMLATSLGSVLGITSDSDDNDPLNEGLSAGDTISWGIIVGIDPVPTEATIKIV